MKNSNINWTRIEKALHQKDKSISIEYIQSYIIPILKKISIQAGEYTNHRVNVISLGESILCHKKLKVIVPVCPDYTHKNGLYTMKGLNAGISLVALKHIDFLLSISKKVDCELEAIFLFADHEEYDADLLSSVNISVSQFRNSIKQSNKLCQNHISRYGWSSKLMSEYIVNLLELEEKASHWIQSQDELKRHIEYDTRKRDFLYLKINQNFSFEEKYKRTVRTASQYYALGSFCTKEKLIVCNHTTTNLSWYNKSATALLHNPVTIY